MTFFISGGLQTISVRVLYFYVIFRIFSGLKSIVSFHSHYLGVDNILLIVVHSAIINILHIKSKGQKNERISKDYV